MSTVADLDGATLALTDASVALASLYPIMAVAPVPQEARGFIEDGMEALTRARRHLNELRPLLADTAGHSVKVSDWHYSALCRVCGHSWQADADTAPCPECDADSGDVAFGPLAGWVRP